jgi:serine/threonine-protein kinase
MRITLTVTEGPDCGRTFTFEEHSIFWVGRSPDVHFVLPNDPYCSRHHFMIEVNPPLCRLISAGRNRTHVNGQPVQTADLKHGDEIRAGQTVLRLTLHEAIAETLPPSTTPPLSTPPETRPAPDRLTIPGYAVLRELGAGGMGVVYHARRLADGCEVALKTILPQKKATGVMIGRFLREAEILKALDHTHIVRFRDMGEAGGRLYFAMDYVEGRDAGHLLKEQGAFAVGRAVPLTCQLLEALAYAHAQGFVHRDIKPSNLMVADEQGREVVKLTDFGLARAYQDSPLSGLTVAGSTGGTPAYMPPEQVLDFRAVKPAADQYSAAATLYALLTSALLYDDVSEPVAFMMKVMQEAPVPVEQRRGDLPRGLGKVIHRALARDARDRYADVEAFRKALLPFGRR